MNLKKILIKHKETAQLIYGIILVVLIPLLIAINTIFIISRYNNGLDIALQRQAMSFGRLISASLQNDLPWDDFIQMRIETLMESDIGIQELLVLKPKGDGLEIIASSDKKLTGSPAQSDYYRAAWTQLQDDEALAVDSTSIADNLGDRALIGAQKNRFWLVTLPLKDADGARQALLSMKISSKIIDELTKKNSRFSTYLLLITMGIVVLFLLVTVRLWDYALLYRKIKEVDRMKDEFTAMASHELRAPIAGIRSCVSMIMEGDFGPINNKVKENLETAQNSSDRLAVLVDDLLNVNQIEQRRIKLNSRAVNINPAIKSVITELKPQAQKKELELKYRPHQEKLPAINIDSDRFKQILINLIGNAIKYTEKGSVEIVTRTKYDHKVLEIMIKDTGIGMSEEEREGLFQKFYRAKNNQTKKIPGTGLGLWITRELVELMNGTISIDSIKDVGTQATLQFSIDLSRN